MAESHHSPTTLAAGESGNAGAPSGLVRNVEALAITAEDVVIPQPLTASPFEPVPPAQYTWVAFDLQTTGFERDAEIIQLAMIHNDSTFTRFILPASEIDICASFVSQLTKSGNALYHEQRPVETVDKQQCFTDFNEFLSGLYSPDRPVLIYGHNARSFDCPRLVDALTSCDLISSFREIVSGFSDTLRAFRSERPELEPHTMEHLVTVGLKEEYVARGALQNVQYLQKLRETVIIDDDILLQHSFTVVSMINRCRYLQRKALLQELVQEGVITKYAADKIATCGLDYDHLVRCYQKRGKDGLVDLLTPVLPKSKDIPQNIAAYLEKKNNATAAWTI